MTFSCSLVGCEYGYRPKKNEPKVRIKKRLYRMPQGDDDVTKAIQQSWINVIPGNI